ncbi:MAG: hypothetical protein OHK0039_16420 [Bacteroidia bacterium]
MPVAAPLVFTDTAEAVEEVLAHYGYAYVLVGERFRDDLLRMLRDRYRDSAFAVVLPREHGESIRLAYQQGYKQVFWRDEVQDPAFVSEQLLHFESLRRTRLLSLDGHLPPQTHRYDRIPHAQILSHIYDAVVMVSSHYQVEYLNPAACRLYGISQEDLGRPLTALYTILWPSEADKWQALQTVNTHGFWRGELPHQRQDGTIFQADTAVSSLYDADGTPAHYLAVIRDVSAYKEAQDSIRRLNQELDFRVQQRTRKLQETVQELETFSYTVSHDLHAPLRIIKSFAQLFERRLPDVLDQQGRDYLHYINESIVKLNNYIRDILNYSRVGRMMPRVQTIDMQALVAEVWGEVVPAGQRVPQFVCDPLPAVAGDLLLLRTVWTNLLQNAVKYSRNESQPCVTVRVRAADEDFVFCVHDNGAGFDMRFVDRIFLMFQRLHTEEEFEGDGVGLAIVKRIVERHHGRVWAESGPGRGTCLYFSLPYVQADSAADPVTDPARVLVPAYTGPL